MKIFRILIIFFIFTNTFLYSQNYIFKPYKTEIKVSSITAKCGLEYDSCEKGIFKNIPDSSSEVLWKCLGSYGGKEKNCSKNIPISCSLSDDSYYWEYYFKISDNCYFVEDRIRYNSNDISFYFRYEYTIGMGCSGSVADHESFNLSTSITDYTLLYNNTVKDIKGDGRIIFDYQRQGKINISEYGNFYDTNLNVDGKQKLCRDSTNVN